MYSFQRAPVVQQQTLAPHGHRGHPNPCGCAPMNGGNGPQFQGYQQFQPLGPGVGPSGQQCPPGPNAPMAAQVTTVPDSGPIYQGAAGVVASGCCIGPPVPALVCVVQDCLPPVLLSCVGGFTEFVIDNFTGAVFVKQKDQVGCVFEESDAACCPPDASIIFSARDPLNPALRVFVAKVNGVCYRRTFDGGISTWTVDDCILKLCGDLKPVFADISGATPIIYTQKDCTQETFRLVVTSQFCPPS